MTWGKRKGPDRSNEEVAAQQEEMARYAKVAAEKPTPISAFEWNGALYRTEQDVQIAKAVRKSQEIWPYSSFGQVTITSVLSCRKDLDKLLALLKEFGLVP